MLMDEHRSGHSAAEAAAVTLLTGRPGLGGDWLILNLRLCETYLVVDADRVRRNHPEAWLWFGWRRADPAALEKDAAPTLLRFSLYNPYDDVLSILGPARVWVLDKRSVHEPTMLKMALERLHLESCCEMLVRECLAGASNATGLDEVAP